MLFSGIVSVFGHEGKHARTPEQLNILGAINALQPVDHTFLVPVTVRVSAARGHKVTNKAYRTASGASYISEKSDSVGEANIVWSALALVALLR